MVCGFVNLKKGPTFIVLREGLLQIQDVRLSGENRSDKMSLLYDYLTSKEFGNQFQAVVDGFVNQKALLERRSGHYNLSGRSEKSKSSSVHMQRSACMEPLKQLPEQQYRL